MGLTENCILNHEEINHKVKRIAYQIYESNVEEQEVILAGIESNGYLFAEKLRAAMVEICDINPVLCKSNKPNHDFAHKRCLHK
jgi:pyrimidine operon attenuation protein/uracil phosphoribosyltransferase